MTGTELAYLAQILGLAAPSQRFGIDENDVVLIGFRCVYHRGQRLTPIPKAPFSRSRATSTHQAKLNQKPAPLHDPAAQAASFNKRVHPTRLTGRQSRCSGVAKPRVSNWVFLHPPCG